MDRVHSLSNKSNIVIWQLVYEPLQAVYNIDGKSTSTCKIIIIEKYLFLEYLFPNGSVVKVLDF